MLNKRFEFKIQQFYCADSATCFKPRQSPKQRSFSRIKHQSLSSGIDALLLSDVRLFLRGTAPKVLLFVRKEYQMGDRAFSALFIYKQDPYKF